MLIIKILSPIFLLVIGLLQIALEHREYWRDRRTKKHKAARTLLVIILFVCAAFTIVTIVVDNNDANELSKKLSGLEEKNKQLIREERDREKIAVEQRNLLEGKIVALNERLDPFVKIASYKFPDIQDEKAALTKLAEEFKKLENRTKQLEEDKKKEKILSTYKQPSISLRSQVISRLKAVATLYENLVIEISCEMGNQKRLRVVKDLVDIIKAAGIPVKFSSSMSGFVKPSPPIKAIFNPNDENLFHKVMSATEGYIGGEVSFTRKEAVQSGTIILNFYGTPFFFTNTGVEFH
jgi:hypothetical protein